MADLSKIKLNGVEYDLKDAVARAAINDGLKLQVVEELPSENIDENTLYLVSEPKLILEQTLNISTRKSITFSRDIIFIENNTYILDISANALSQNEIIDSFSYSGSFTWAGEDITLITENDWVLTARTGNSIRITYNGTQDSLTGTISLYEVDNVSNNRYSSYLYINNNWEQIDDANGNNFMQKGKDYVTAGQLNGSSLGYKATAEGVNTTASGLASHAEGNNTTASALASHAEGFNITASGDYSHAEGNFGEASGESAHIEGRGYFSQVIKITGEANVKTYNFTWVNTSAKAICIGQKVSAYVGNQIVSNTVTALDKDNNIITFANTFNSEASVLQLAISIQGTASGLASHAEGYGTTASNQGAHAEGGATVAAGVWSHAEGYATRTSAGQAHAEGMLSTASNVNAHAEGYNTNASGISSHAEGGTTKALGDISHSEGAATIASGYASHAEGSYTIATRESQHVFGEYNIADTVGANTVSRGAYIEIVGNGTADDARSNARTLDWSGNEWLAGKLTIGAAPVNNMDVATKQYVDNSIPIVPTNVSDLTNDSGFITSSDLPTLATVATTGSYNDLSDTPTIPTTISELTNDSGFITSADLPDTSNYMVKGTDYVTAGQKSGSDLGARATAEGTLTIASGNNSHAEGRQTQAIGSNSHAEGRQTEATGASSHAEGQYTYATGASSHAEGVSTKASGVYSHAEGGSVEASGTYAHAEGYGTFFGVIEITGEANVKTYNFTWVNTSAKAICIGQKVSANIEGHSILNIVTDLDKDNNTITFADTFNSEASVSQLSVSIKGTASGDYSHAEGSATTANNDAAHAEGGATVAAGGWSHAEGYATRAAAFQSHAEGSFSTALGVNSHAEGYNTNASGISSHAEGGTTTASGDGSHSEGGMTKASGRYSHSEGYSTIASNVGSHAEGHTTTSSGLQSHSEGWSTVAIGDTSHAEGQFTIAAKQSQHVFGEANIEDVNTTTKSRGSYVEIVGNGTIDSSGDTPVVTRSNARTLDWSGNEVLAGKLTMGAGPTADMDAATKQYVDSSITTAIGGITTFNATIVTDLPTTDIDTHTIYFKSNSSSGNNVYDEYMYINNNWELIGSTQIDLTPYAQSADLATVATSGDYNDLSNKPTIPEDKLFLVNVTLDGWAGTSDKSSAEIAAAANAGKLPIVRTSMSNMSMMATLVNIEETQENEETQYTATFMYNDENTAHTNLSTFITKAVMIISGTNVTLQFKSGSYVTNYELEEKGYLTSYTETDPTVPAWAKAESKPTYTAAEVGALPDTTIIPEDKIFPVNITLTSMTEGTSDKSHTEILAAVNAGKIPLAYGTFGTSKLVINLAYADPSGAKFVYLDQHNSTIKYAELIVINNNVTISATNDTFAMSEDIDVALNGLATVTKSGSYNDLSDTPALATVATSGSYNDLSDTPTIPTTTSELINDSGFITSNDIDISTFMVKGTDYVTAGQKSGTTLGENATAEGYETTASGYYSHAEGSHTTASGSSSHTEGDYTTASGFSSHAEGSSTHANGQNSHAEGNSTTAEGDNSHVEGQQTFASGQGSHAEGQQTVASGQYSHAEGNGTAAQRRSQHVFGEYNIADATGTTDTRGTYVEIVGNGIELKRSNARTLDWQGNEVLAGKLTVGAAPTANMDVATKQYVDNSTTVTNTLSSGTLIATINGTNIYAPAYVDADGVSY